MRPLLAAAVLLLLAALAEAQPMATVANVNENTATTWPVDFTDSNKQPATPTTASKKVITYLGNVLVAPTAFTPSGPHTDVPIPALQIPPAELNASNPRLPEKIPVALVISSTWAGGAPSDSFVWFSLVNVP